jgi:beta-glucosidase
VVHDALGDVVKHWITLNEPKVSSHAGYGSGIHAPGIKDQVLRDRAVHHLMLAHGLGLQALRGGRHSQDQVLGITLDVSPVKPFTDSEADVAAARRVDVDSHRLFLDPLLGGAYPVELEAVQDGDLELISAPIDFLGINYYRRILVQAGPTGDETVLPAGVPVTSVNWPVQPDGLREVLVELHADYDLPPVYITENGAAYDDVPAEDGTVDDPLRVDYLQGHLAALRTAVAAGVDVRGYFVWTLLDNFEWAEGYAKRFGIVHVDFPTQTRTPKSSAGWLGRVARANALPSGSSTA